MTIEQTGIDALTGARRLVDVTTEAAENAIAAASRLTDGGRLIDEHQVHAERIAQLATEARAAAELLAYAEGQAGAGKPDSLEDEQAFAFAAEVVHRLRGAVEVRPE